MFDETLHGCAKARVGENAMGQVRGAARPAPDGPYPEYRGGHDGQEDTQDTQQEQQPAAGLQPGSGGLV